jgi:hypothetical protein
MKQKFSFNRVGIRSTLLSPQVVSKQYNFEKEEQVQLMKETFFDQESAFTSRQQSRKAVLHASHFTTSPFNEEKMIEQNLKRRLIGFQSSYLSDAKSHRTVNHSMAHSITNPDRHARLNDKSYIHALVEPSPVLKLQSVVRNKPKEAFFGPQSSRHNIQMLGNLQRDSPDFNSFKNILADSRGPVIIDRSYNKSPSAYDLKNNSRPLMPTQLTTKKQGNVRLNANLNSHMVTQSLDLSHLKSKKDLDVSLNQHSSQVI